MSGRLTQQNISASSSRSKGGHSSAAPAVEPAFVFSVSRGPLVAETGKTLLFPGLKPVPGRCSPQAVTPFRRAHLLTECLGIVFRSLPPRAV